MENKRIIQVDEKVPFKMLVPLSIQHMFAMFGASVLVPFVFGINPAVVLFMNGLGTLLFILITKGSFLHRLELLSQNGDTVMHWEALLQSDSADVFYL